MSRTRWLLSPQASFRLGTGDEVECAVDDAVTRIPLELYRFALAFSTPGNVEEVVTRDLDTDCSLSDLEVLVRRLVDAGVLVDAEASAAEQSESLDTLSFLKPGVLDAAAPGLAAGRAVVIPNALDSDLAEAAHAALLRSEHWQPYERHAPFFHFRHHNLYAREHFPAPMRAVERAFASERVRAKMSEASVTDCMGKLAIGASVYLPGDYSLPHLDTRNGRALAYVWYLTKDWNPEWGGQFVWCPTGAMMMPTFNTLVLFRVGPASLHFVAPVSARATGRRMAINGWWHRREAAPAVEPRIDQPLAAFLPGAYGEETRSVAPAEGDSVIWL